MFRLAGVEYLRDGMTAIMSKHAELEVYRVYKTDCLYLICCALGNDPGIRYYDVIHPKEEDDRPCEDIVSERLERFGIKVVD